MNPWMSSFKALKISSFEWKVKQDLIRTIISHSFIILTHRLLDESVLGSDGNFILQSTPYVYMKLYLKTKTFPITFIWLELTKRLFILHLNTVMYNKYNIKFDFCSLLLSSILLFDTCTFLKLFEIRNKFDWKWYTHVYTMKRNILKLLL